MGIETLIENGLDQIEGIATDVADATQAPIANATSAVTAAAAGAVGAAAEWTETAAAAAADAAKDVLKPAMCTAWETAQTALTDAFRAAIEGFDLVDLALNPPDVPSLPPFPELPGADALQQLVDGVQGAAKAALQALSPATLQFLEIVEAMSAGYMPSAIVQAAEAALTPAQFELWNSGFTESDALDVPLDAVMVLARTLGYKTLTVGAQLTGSAREVSGSVFVTVALDLAELGRCGARVGMAATKTVASTGDPTAADYKQQLRVGLFRSSIDDMAKGSVGFFLAGGIGLADLTTAIGINPCAKTALDVLDALVLTSPLGGDGEKVTDDATPQDLIDVSLELGVSVTKAFTVETSDSVNAALVTATGASGARGIPYHIVTDLGDDPDTVRWHLHADTSTGEVDLVLGRLPGSFWYIERADNGTSRFLCGSDAGDKRLLVGRMDSTDLATAALDDETYSHDRNYQPESVWFFSPLDAVPSGVTSGFLFSGEGGLVSAGDTVDVSGLSRTVVYRSSGNDPSFSREPARAVIATNAEDSFLGRVDGALSVVVEPDPLRVTAWFMEERDGWVELRTAVNGASKYLAREGGAPVLVDTATDAARWVRTGFGHGVFTLATPDHTQVLSVGASGPQLVAPADAGVDAKLHYVVAPVVSAEVRFKIGNLKALDVTGGKWSLNKTDDIRVRFKPGGGDWVVVGAERKYKKNDMHNYNTIEEWVWSPDPTSTTPPTCNVEVADIHGKTADLIKDQVFNACFPPHTEVPFVSGRYCHATAKAMSGNNATYKLWYWWLVDYAVVPYADEPDAE